MNTEQEREDFETCHVKLFGKKPLRQVNSDKYVYDSHQSRWEVWRARAALQSQDREDAERYRWLCDKFGITKLPCALERIIAGDVYVADGKAGIDEAIDHARRIEGDGE